MDDLKKMRGFPNMNWMVRSAMRMTRKNVPGFVKIDPNTYVQQNGDIQVTFCAKSGNVLQIKNMRTRKVYASSAAKHSDNENSKDLNETPVVYLSNGVTYKSPFKLYLFWRQFGENHLGCVLVPQKIEATLVSTVHDKVNNTTTFTWDITKLADIKWAYINAELGVLSKIETYYEKVTINNIDFLFTADLTPTIPKEVNINGQAFLRAKASVRITDDGQVLFGDFSVVKLNDEKKGKDFDLHFGLHGFEYPVIRGFTEPDPLNGDRNYMVYPHMEGKELRNPIERLTEKDRDGKAVGFLTMKYPMSYDGTMQFMALFAKGKKPGIYIVTEDESMKEKTFIWKAARKSRTLSFSMVHWSDDVWDGYTILQRTHDSGENKFLVKAAELYQVDNSLLLTDPGTWRWQVINQPHDPDEKIELSKDYEEYVPNWRDYRQDDYWVTISELYPKGVNISWYDAADRYKKWARAANGPVWASNPRTKRDRFRFYEKTGYAVWLLGSEFSLSGLTPSGQPYNFLQSFHDVLKPVENESERTRVLFVMGWDWHSPWGKRLNDGKQFGNNAQYWRSRFGPTYDSQTATETDNIFLNLDQIREQGDFILPYTFAMKITKATEQRFPGWESETKGDPGSPWKNKRIVPDTWGYMTRLHHFICPATSAYRNFIKNRDSIIRNGNFDEIGISPFLKTRDVSNPLVAKSLSRYLDGVYHDVGLTFAGSRCYHCDHPGSVINPESPHDHFTADHSNGFQVGAGGFLNRAKREVLRGNNYNYGVRPVQLFGTEGMTEIFIDLVDCYGMAVTWGPYKDLFYENEPGYNPIYGKDIIVTHGGFSGWVDWVMKRTCNEIPMLQYIYNPVMPLKLSGHLNLAGSDSQPVNKHHIGKSFYWVVASSYLYGMISRLDYDKVLVDIFPNMPSDTPTYILDWNRFPEYPETSPVESMNDYGDPNPGKHPQGQDDKFDTLNRTCAHAKKIKYLRMLSYMRTQIVPEFLVYGEMIRPGVIPNEQNNYKHYDYDFFQSMNGWINEHSTYFWKNTMPSDSTYWYWNARPLIVAAWKDQLDNTNIKIPRAIYIVANSSNNNITFNYKVVSDLFGEGKVNIEQLHMVFTNEYTWNAWRVWEEGLFSHNGILQHTFNITLSAYDVCIFLLKALKR